MNCNNCGTYNNPGSTNCQRCGAPIANNVPNNQMNNGMQQMMRPQQPVQPQQMMNQQPQMGMQQMMRPQQSVQPQQMMNQQVQQSNNEKKPFDKKLLAIPVVALVLVGAFFLIKSLGIFGGTKSKEINSKYIKAIYNENNPIPYYKDGMYGFTDSNGKVIIDAKYDSIYTSFFDNFAVVKSGYKYFLINKNGEEIDKDISSYISYDYDTSTQNLIFNKKLYDSNLKLLNGDKGVKKTVYPGVYSWEKDDNAGLLNSKGKVIYTVNSSFIGVSTSYNADYDETYCRINARTNAIVNCKTGKEILKNERAIDDEGDNIFELSLDGSSSKYVFIHKDKIYFESKDRMEYNNGYVEVYDGNSTIYEVSSKKKLNEFPKEYLDKSSKSDDKILYSGEDYVKFFCDNGVGVKKGEKIVVPCKWKSISIISEKLNAYLSQKGKKYALAFDANKSYLINVKNGKVIKEFNVERYGLNFGQSMFINYKDASSGEQVVYNIVNGKSKTFSSDAKITVNYTFVGEETSDKINYYNSKLKQVSSGTK